MANIIGVTFHRQGQIYYFDASPYVVNLGDHVLVQTQEGINLAKIVQIREDLPEGLAEEDLKSVIRIATQEDLATEEENLKVGREAFEYCREKIKEYELDMKLVGVDVHFDRSKMIFFFTAPGRIDFRELVKDLVAEYRARIELRQIGVRHEAQMVGGIGNCGQVCCCRRFLRHFEPVTIKMAKEQQLFLNPSKISGSCGRLLCCLNFEKETYSEFHKRCPKIGKKFDTTLGRVKVLRGNLLKESLVLYTESGEEKEISLEDWNSIVVRRSSQAPDGGEAQQTGKNIEEVKDIESAEQVEEKAEEVAANTAGEEIAEEPSEANAGSGAAQEKKKPRRSKRKSKKRASGNKKDKKES
jgi:cell fate regulator YaaT (PSP1 superfamily)